MVQEEKHRLQESVTMSQHGLSGQLKWQLKVLTCCEPNLRVTSDVHIGSNGICRGVHTASHGIDRLENLLSLLSLLSLRFVLKVTVVAVA